MPMQRKPIDLTRLGTLRCAIEPEPRLDMDGEVRRDRDGNPLWVTSVAVRQLESRTVDTFDVVTPLKPTGLVEGGEVKITNLWANDWEIDGRKGVSFRADAITPAPVSVPAAGGGTSAATSPARGGKGGAV
ncbi:hypothetical protein [Streptomyces sp. NPDC050485]|uniref:hypothetical protein n=1 Tax=Streptomyces sp. NPDC050485 TaxID=3365617 RepID=UPI00379D5E92